MKKDLKNFLLAVILSFLCCNFTYAQENLSPTQNPNVSTIENKESAQVNSSLVEVSNQTPPKLVTPVVEDPKVNVAPKSSGTKKVNLNAVIFDPNAQEQLEAEAKAEGREMTKLEKAEYNLNEALHCEVCSVNKISRKGLLVDHTTWRPKHGIIDSMTPWFNYKSGFQDVWSGDNYKNSLYSIDSMTVGVDGKFKNKKTVFRLMGNLGMSKEGHTFFNDFIGDTYLMHYLTPDDQILVGYARSAVGVEGGVSPFALPFYARSQIAKTYGNVRNLGIKAQGVHKFYDYSASFASSGRYFMDWVPGPEFVGWANIKPLAATNGKYGNLTMGGGINAGNAEKRYTVGSAYIEYEYKRWDLVCEYASAEGSNGSTGYTANHSEGYVGTLSYRITPKLQILARYDKMDPNKEKMNDMRTEYTAGLNYYIKGQSLRAILNYVYYTVENGTYGSQIVTGLQIVL